MDPKQNKTDEKAIKDQVALASFVDDLIRDRKDPNITPQALPKVKAMLLSELNQAVNKHLIDRLSHQDQLALDEMLNKNATDDEIDKFFIQKIPSIQVEVAAALLNFRAAYLMPLQMQQEAAGVQNQEQSSSMENIASGGVSTQSQDQADIPPPPPPPAPVKD